MDQRLILVPLTVLAMSCSHLPQRHDTSISNSLGAAKGAMHKRWGAPIISGPLPEVPDVDGYEVYHATPKKYWTADHSAWVVLYRSGKVVQVNEDWTDLTRTVRDAVDKDYKSYLENEYEAYLESRNRCER